MGFKKKEFKTHKKSHIADKTHDILAGNHTLYVYSDLVHPQYVGNKKLSLLRAVPFTGEDGKLEVVTFNPPYYLPLQQSQIHSIHIAVCNELAEPVPFEKGSVICVLHICPK